MGDAQSWPDSCICGCHRLSYYLRSPKSILGNIPVALLTQYESHVFQSHLCKRDRGGLHLCSIELRNMPRTEPARLRRTPAEVDAELVLNGILLNNIDVRSGNVPWICSWCHADGNSRSGATKHVRRCGGVNHALKARSGSAPPPVITNTGYGVDSPPGPASPVPDPLCSPGSGGLGLQHAGSTSPLHSDAQGPTLELALAMAAADEYQVILVLSPCVRVAGWLAVATSHSSVSCHGSCVHSLFTAAQQAITIACRMFCNGYQRTGSLLLGSMRVSCAQAWACARADAVLKTRQLVDPLTSFTPWLWFR